MRRALASSGLPAGSLRIAVAINGAPEALALALSPRPGFLVGQQHFQLRRGISTAPLGEVTGLSADDEGHPGDHLGGAVLGVGPALEHPVPVLDVAPVHVRDPGGVGGLPPGHPGRAVPQVADQDGFRRRRYLVVHAPHTNTHECAQKRFTAELRRFTRHVRACAHTLPTHDSISTGTGSVQAAQERRGRRLPRHRPQQAQRADPDRPARLRRHPAEAGRQAPRAPDRAGRTGPVHRAEPDGRVMNEYIVQVRKLRDDGALSGAALTYRYGSPLEVLDRVPCPPTPHRDAFAAEVVALGSDYEGYIKPLICRVGPDRPEVTS